MITQFYFYFSELNFIAYIWCKNLFLKVRLDVNVRPVLVWKAFGQNKGHLSLEDS